MRRRRDIPDNTPNPRKGYNDTFRPHREIANILGLGRARVFHQEHQALRKMREVFLREGFTGAQDLDSERTVEVPGESERAEGLYSVNNGWLRISKIVSLNYGSTDLEDVVRAYRFLKEAHEKTVKPPALISTTCGTFTPYTIEAVAEYDSAMHVRCWPIKKASRSVKPFSDCPCTAIVESEFDRDERGAFDVPILVCVIVSARDVTGLEL